MPSYSPLEVAAVSVSSGTFLINDGRIGMITNHYAYGEDSTPTEAKVVVGYLDGMWFTIDLTAFTKATIQ